MSTDDMGTLLGEIAEEPNNATRLDDFQELPLRWGSDDARVRGAVDPGGKRSGQVCLGTVAPRATKASGGCGLALPPRAFAPPQTAGIRAFLLACVIRKALRPLVDLWADRPSLICLDLPEGCVIESASIAIHKLLAPLDRRTVERAKTNDLVQTVTVKLDEGMQARSLEARRRQSDVLMRDLRDHFRYVRRVFLLVEHGAGVAPEIARFCDERISVPVPDRRHLAAVCRLRLGIQPTEAMLDGLMAVPLAEIDLVLRPSTMIRQLRKILSRRDHAAATRPRREPETDLSLDTLPGMGEAAMWGRELARDLQDWRDGVISWHDVDRGILLHGEPGTGKTTFARALAASCKVPLIATSLSQWQSMGHLGDLLGAMRKDFAEARDKAPSILFIDELDSLGVRAQFSGEHRTYSLQVVNGMLECLDGIEAREGVVVVGACNDPSTIDPAVLRAGRLDRQVEIPLPDLMARIAILRFHLGSDAERLSKAFGAGCDSLALVAERLPGASGADIERLVRDARRLARRARRPIEVDDLLRFTPVPIRLSEEERRRFAIHEVGHALVVVMLSAGHLDSVWMVGDGKRPLGDDGVLAAARCVPPLRAAPTLDDLETELTKLLAGTAAEAVLLGNRSTGASGADHSDLARATLTAARIELHHSLGTMLAAITSDNQTEIRRLLQRDKDLRARVDIRLKAAYGKAETLIRDNVHIVEQLARELMKHGELSGDRVRELVASSNLPAI